MIRLYTIEEAEEILSRYDLKDLLEMNDLEEADVLLILLNEGLVHDFT